MTLRLASYKKCLLIALANNDGKVLECQLGVLCDKYGHDPPQAEIHEVYL